MIIENVKTYTELFENNFKCTCGKKHYSKIDDIIIKKDAIAYLPELMVKYEAKKIFLVADNNTYVAAGEISERILIKNRIDVKKCIFEQKEHLSADEKAIGRLLFEIDGNVDLIIVVGSGTLCDIGKVLSNRLKIPFVMIVTAPSVDGFASTVAALVIDKMKTTIEAAAPKAIIADINILKNAPMPMILAGVGDILGKYTSLCDWQLGRIINDEYYCEAIAGFVRELIKKCIKSTAGIKNREDEAIQNIIEGLVLSGIAMGYAGNSRPASGSEHHIAHFWEMMSLLEEKEVALHGERVGVAEIAVLKLYEMLLDKKLDFEKIKSRISSNKQTERIEYIRKIFRITAPTIIAQDKKMQINAPDKILKRVETARNRWEEIIDTVRKSVPSANKVKEILKTLGAPISPGQIEIDEETFFNSIMLAKEIRPRYSILQFLSDLGLLQEFAFKLKEYFFIKEESSDKEITDKTKNILKDIRCFILDMDGTFYLENKLFDGSLEFIQTLGKHSKEYYFFTNNSSINADVCRKKLEKMGCRMTKEKILTSNQVIIQYINKKMLGKRIYLLGTKYLEADFKEAEIEFTDNDPDVVIVGFDTTLTYEKVANACEFIRKGVPFLAVNQDLNCPIGNGFLPDCGSMCAMITASTGVEPIYFGKPTKHTLNYILKKTGFKEREIAFIGDRLYTDVAMGEGTEAITILVLSGETKKEDLSKSNFNPTLIFNSLKDLGDMLKKIYGTVNN